MNINEISQKKSILKEYEIKIDREDSWLKVEQAIEEKQAGYIMPGFRKGSVPIEIVRDRFEKTILEDYINKKVPEILKEIESIKEYEYYNEPHKLDQKNIY